MLYPRGLQTHVHANSPHSKEVGIESWPLAAPRTISELRQRKLDLSWIRRASLALEGGEAGCLNAVMA